VEAVQGEQRAALNIGIGWRGLNEDVERFKDNLEFTKLKNNQEGIDPDDVYSQVPYEKGFQFLWRIERQVSEFVFPCSDVTCPLCIKFLIFVFVLQRFCIN